MDAAEAHQQLTRATGAAPESSPATLRGTIDAAVRGLESLVALVEAASKLAEVAGEAVDQDGREIWMTAGEVELDQWCQRLTDEAAAVRRQIGGSA